MKKSVLGVDQYTQGNKALISDPEGKILAWADLFHRQMVNEKGWAEHDPEKNRQNSVQMIYR